MADETTAFVAEIHGDAEPLKKAFKEAEGAASSGSEAILRELQKIESGFEQVKNAVSSVEGAISFFGRLAIGGAAISAAVKIAADEFERLAKIGQAADAIGITTEAYQKFAYALTQAGVKEDQQAEALTHFAEQANYASRGFGALYDALGKYDQQARSSLAGVSDFSKQLAIVADAVNKAAGEQRRGAITAAAFGKSNAEAAEFLRAGAAAIKEAGDQAKDLGLIAKEGDIRNAQELKEKFDELSKTLENDFKRVLVDLAPVIVKTADAIETLAWAGGFAWKVIEKLGGSLLDMLSSLEGKSTEGLTGVLETAKTQLEAIDKMLAERGNATNTFVDPFGFSSGNVEEDLQRQKANVEQYIQNVQRILDARKAAEDAPPSPVKKPGFTNTPNPGPSEQSLAKGQSILNSIETDYLKATQQNTVLIQLEYENRLTSLKKALAEGQIAYEDYVEAEEQMEIAATAKIQAEAVKKIQPLTNAISGDLSSAFDELWNTGKINSDKFFNDLAKDIAKVALQMYVLQPLFGGGATPGGGAIGGLLAGVFHDGGIAGEAGPSRRVPAIAFAGAPRYHDGGVAGLKPGEVPAILQRGEGVLSRGQMAQGAGGNSTVVNIVNQSGGEVSQQRRREGNVDILDIVVGKVKENMAGGGFDGIMRGRFATPVATGRR